MKKSKTAPRIKLWIKIFLGFSAHFCIAKTEICNLKNEALLWSCPPEKSSLTAWCIVLHIFALSMLTQSFYKSEVMAHTVLYFYFCVSFFKVLLKSIYIFLKKSCLNLFITMSKKLYHRKEYFLSLVAIDYHPTNGVFESLSPMAIFIRRKDGYVNMIQLF